MIDYKLLTNPYFIAIGIPVILLLAGSFAKKLVRGPGWEAKDFFLGIESTLAAMTSALIFIFDIVKEISIIKNPNSIIVTTKLSSSAGFIAICFLLLMWVMATHQNWEYRSDNPKLRIFWLGIICNLIGSGLIIAFVLLVKGTS